MLKYHGVLWQTKQSEWVHLIVKQTSYPTVTSGVSDLSLDSPLCPRPSPVPQWQTSDIPLIFISGSWARPAPDQGNQSREHLEMNRHCSYRYGSNGPKEAHRGLCHPEMPRLLLYPILMKSACYYRVADFVNIDDSLEIVSITTIVASGISSHRLPSTELADPEKQLITAWSGDTGHADANTWLS